MEEPCSLKTFKEAECVNQNDGVIQQIAVTSLPLLTSPVLLYSPSHFPTTSLAGPVRLTFKQQGGELTGGVQVKLASSSQSLGSDPKALGSNCQPLVG